MRKYALLSILWASLVQLCAFQGLPSRVNMNTWGFGPWVQSSVGSPLPTPQTFRSTAEQLVVDPNNFVFNYAANTQCEVVVKGIERYRERIFNPARWPRKPAEINIQQHPKDTSKVAQQQAVKVLQNLEIIISGSVCDTQPKFGDDEQYTLKINWEDLEPGTSTLSSPTVWGVLRGLDTFSQLVFLSPDDGRSFIVNTSLTTDFPRYSWRGVLVDTSRHFLPVSLLREVIDIMEQNKLNVFHWHIVDDNSFPFESEVFPELSNQGRYHPGRTYSPAQVIDVIEHARLRGIRVVPEFDTPGHTQSWGPGQPGLLTACSQAKLTSAARPFLPYGPIDPSKDANYEFLRRLFDEITRVFPDEFLHLGGDEVDFACWASNEDVKNYMDQLNITGDYAALEAHYIHRLIDIINSLEKKKKPIVWQEVFDNGVPLSNDTVVHVWIGDNWQDEMAKVTRANKKVILSAGWYLNYISYGLDWEKYYLQDPEGFQGTPQQRALVQGGELCMWGEYVDYTALVSRMFPRGSVIAERLWSSANVVDVNNMAARLEEHRCRLVRRGHDAQPPNGSGFCPFVVLD